VRKIIIKIKFSLDAFGFSYILKKQKWFNW